MLRAPHCGRLGRRGKVQTTRRGGALFAAEAGRENQASGRSFVFPFWGAAREEGAVFQPGCDELGAATRLRVGGHRGRPAMPTQTRSTVHSATCFIRDSLGYGRCCGLRSLLWPPWPRSRRIVVVLVTCRVWHTGQVCALPRYVTDTRSGRVSECRLATLHSIGTWFDFVAWWSQASLEAVFDRLARLGQCQSRSSRALVRLPEACRLLPWRPRREVPVGSLCQHTRQGSRCLGRRQSQWCRPSDPVRHPRRWPLPRRRANKHCCGGPRRRRRRL